MELEKEFIEIHKLTEEQASAINKYYGEEVIPSIKKEYDGLANKNAESILEGASKALQSKFGITDERQQGEKIADFISRIVEKPFETTKAELEKNKKEYEEKLKNFKGDDELKGKYEKLVSTNDELLKQLAELEPLKGLDVKLQEKDQELSGLKLNVAFNSIKPSFPDTANKYEVDAKWNNFQKDVLEKYVIEIEDGKPMAVDKENHHKKVKLSDLLEANKDISELLQGRKQEGVNGKPANLLDVSGVPFKVPEGATTEELSTLVRDHLEKKLGNRLHPSYAKEFQDLMLKIKQPA